MVYKKFRWRIILKVVVLFIVLCLAAFLLVKGNFLYLLVIVPVIIYLLYDLYRSQEKAYEELKQFVESVHYRDFSRYFDVTHAPADLQPLRHGFNEINSTFKVISKEKETQYLYLQRILELVETGILSYEEITGEIVWMNESLKKMLEIPYLKTIHSLSKRDPELKDAILSLKPGASKIAAAHLEKNTFKILLSATSFQTDQRIFKLVAFQNVNEALDETESKAWQKLLSVLTHEIMNSVAPISSLAETLKSRLQKISSTIDTEPGAVDDLEVGIETIRRRSEGLLKFAESYRSLNKITTLNLNWIYVRDIFENLLRLMQPTLEQKNIEFETILKDPELMIEADTGLIEQVMINLVINAIEAVKENPKPAILLSSYLSGNGKPVIKVADNGAGIPVDVQDKIFVPFFSTRKTGTGIGLSLCKQIMMLHKGNIHVQSKEGKGTAFLLHF